METNLFFSSSSSCSFLASVKREDNEKLIGLLEWLAIDALGRSSSVSRETSIGKKNYF